MLPENFLGRPAWVYWKQGSRAQNHLYGDNEIHWSAPSRLAWRVPSDALLRERLPETGIQTRSDQVFLPRCSRAFLPCADSQRQCACPYQSPRSPHWPFPQCADSPLHSRVYFLGLVGAPSERSAGGQWLSQTQFH